ncbi:hypothetical protein [Chitinivorax sp. B]|uniref:hypothetical protein n=1 Tax=Chitinivorax sp. B TaxID=2502235 RepID=UPI0010F4FB1A|nr:hypothetical protein [Chitinivorax sp. B]
MSARFIVVLILANVFLYMVWSDANQLEKLGAISAIFVVKACAISFVIGLVAGTMRLSKASDTEAEEYNPFK